MIKTHYDPLIRKPITLNLRYNLETDINTSYANLSNSVSNLEALNSIQFDDLLSKISRANDPSRTLKVVLDSYRLKINSIKAEYQNKDSIEFNKALIKYTNHLSNKIRYVDGIEKILHGMHSLLFSSMIEIKLILEVYLNDDMKTAELMKWLSSVKSVKKIFLENIEKYISNILIDIRDGLRKNSEGVKDYIDKCTTFYTKVSNNNSKYLSDEIGKIILYKIRFIFIQSILSELLVKDLYSNIDTPNSSIEFLYLSLELGSQEYNLFVQFYYDYLNARLNEYGLNSNTIDKIYEFYQIQKTQIIDKIFKEDYVLKSELTRAYENLNRENPDRAADLLSRYVSEQLTLKKNIDEMNDEFENLLTLFSHLSAKDMFMSLYNQRLVRRLIGERFSGIDSEKKMIEKFKKFAGEFFVSNTELLLSQYERSFTSMELFEKMFRSKKGTNVSEMDSQDIKLYVFPSHVWPFPHFVSIEEYLPDEVSFFHLVSFDN